jgi:hypothetical protein
MQMTSDSSHDSMPIVHAMTWGFMAHKGEWLTREALRSFDTMVSALGIDTVVLPVLAWQDKAQSTDICFSSENTVSDDEVKVICARAHQKGLRVILKPMVNVKDGTWRAHINFFDVDVPGEPCWNDWFASYTAFMTHMAALAEEIDCFMFSVGCELVQSERREDEWRQLIKAVRGNYSGLITLNTDKYQEDRVHFWDAVDVISSSGYYPTGSWPVQIERISKVAQTYKKPLFFLEAGCPSHTGASLMPNNWERVAPADEQEQAAYYREFFSATTGLPWFYGWALWDWPANLYSEESARLDGGYCVYGKSAQQVIHTAFS